MTPPRRDLDRLLSRLTPTLQPGTYVYASLAGVAAPPPALAAVAVATVREAEGLSVVVEAAQAAAFGLAPQLAVAWLTLAVSSDLAGCGLTAEVSTALAEAGIACNMVAGCHHDHLFVPVADAQAALARLRALQADAAGRRGAAEGVPR